MALQSGTHLGAYIVLRQIGAGGMGEVYRARDPRLDRDVAIKVLPPGVSTDAGRMARFEQEARAAAALSHPNILAVYDIGRHEGSPYIVSEILEGMTLRERLQAQDGGLPVRKTIDYAVQIARGLAAAHDKGIIHRDLKPENVFITEDGRAKILDFGLAKLTQTESAEASEAATKTGSDPSVVVGTVGYMSPEQIRGQTADHRSDIFSFGVVLYELLSGKKAFRENSAVETMNAILKEEPPDLPIAERQIPPALGRIVNRCLEKSAAARFQSTTDLAFALEALSSTSGSQVSIEAIPPPASKVSRLPWVIAAVLTVVLLVVGVLVFNYSRSAPPEETTRFFVAPPDGWKLAQLGAGGAAAVGPLSISPDGRQVAFVARDATGKTRIWLRSLNTVVVKGLEGTDGGTSPFWSPDSRYIAFFANGMLQKISVDGGAPVALCRAAPGISGSWSRENVIVFSERGGTPLLKVSAAGGEPAPATQLGNDENAHARPFFLPDGKHFLFRSGLGAATRRPVYVGSIDSTTDRKRLIETDSTNIIYSRGYLLFLSGATLMAQPFDPKTQTVTDAAVPVAERIQRFGVPNYGFFAASENGVLVYQTEPQLGDPQLTWFDRSGNMLGTVGNPAPYGGIALSPDGTRAVAYRRNAGQSAAEIDLWMIDLERDGLATRFTFETGADYDPVWSHDGKTVIFTSDRSGVPGFYQKASSGAGAEQLVFGEKTTTFRNSTDWSHDGRFLAFTMGGGRQNLGDVWILPLTGDRTPFPFYTGPQHDTNARFSPDGHWIAYNSNENGAADIYVSAFDGSGPASGAKRQVSSGGGNLPKWRGDGKELFFMSPAPDRILMAVPVSGEGASFNVGKVEKLFPIRGEFEVTADGKRFLVNQAPAPPTAAQPITVVMNWIAGLKK